MTKKRFRVEVIDHELWFDFKFKKEIEIPDGFDIRCVGKGIVDNIKIVSEKI